MNKIFYKIFLVFFCVFLSTSCLAKTNLPYLFLFLGGDNACAHEKELANAYVAGVQIIYSWKQLEPQKGVYDFSKIENDLICLKKNNKRLFIQLQDRSFEPTTFNVPDYIREEAEYHGGVAMQYDFPGAGKAITSGWVARVWDPAVSTRFHLLMEKLATQFDGIIYGINLPETAVDFDWNNPPRDFTYDKYFAAELNNISTLKKSFKNSIVIQYVNFFPGEWDNDRQYMSRLFAYAVEHQIGLGGPDVVPYKNSHMENSYPFFNKYNENMITGMAIQEPDYTYINPKTNDYYQFADFYSFTTDYLGVSIVFWNVQEPFFSEQLLPKLNEQYFNIWI